MKKASAQMYLERGFKEILLAILLKEQPSVQNMGLLKQIIFCLLPQGLFTQSKPSDMLARASRQTVTYQGRAWKVCLKMISN